MALATTPRKPGDDTPNSTGGSRKKKQGGGGTKRPSGGGGGSAPKGSFDQQIEWFMAGLRQYESGNGYSEVNPYSQASGAYQYIDSTWNNYGGYARAADAPKAVQDEKARADITALYHEYGNWQQVAAAWLFPAWAGDKSKWDQSPAPHNPTVNEYVNGVMGDMSAASNGKFKGGGGNGGNGGVGAGGGGVGPHATDQQITDYIKQNYGDVAAFLDIPAIKNILFRAARQGWDATRLEGAVKDTQWWKTHSASVRNWIVTQNTDPATAKQQLNQQTADVKVLANTLGVTLSDADAQTIAQHSLMFGWDNTLIQKAIGAHFQYKNGTSYQGTAGTTVDSLRGLANDYLVPISDQRVNNWTRQVLEGRTTADGFKDTLIQQAASLYPQFKKDLESGQTMQQIVDPYKQLAAQTLEIDPATIDFTKPKWNTAINQVDPTTNQRHAMSLSDWQTYMMTNDSYGYDHTQGALQQAAQLVSGLKQRMGFE